jgi:hypothetical protein
MLKKAVAAGARVVVGAVDVGATITREDVDVVVFDAYELGVKQETTAAGLVTIVV